MLLRFLFKITRLIRYNLQKIVSTSFVFTKNKYSKYIPSITTILDPWLLLQNKQRCKTWYIKHIIYLTYNISSKSHTKSLLQFFFMIKTPCARFYLLKTTLPTIPFTFLTFCLSFSSSFFFIIIPCGPSTPCHTPPPHIAINWLHFLLHFWLPYLNN